MRINEIEAKHSNESIKQITDNSRRRASGPGRREGEDAQQIIDTAPKMLNLFGGTFGLCFHASFLLRLMGSAQFVVHGALVETRLEARRMDFAEGFRQ